MSRPPWVAFGVPWLPPRPHPEPPRPTPCPPGRGVAEMGSGPPRALPRRGALGHEVRSRRERPAGAGPFPLAGSGSPSRARRRSGSAPSAGGVCVCVCGAGASGSPSSRSPLPPPPPLPRPVPGVCAGEPPGLDPLASEDAPDPAGSVVRLASPRRLWPRRRGARPAPVPGFSLACASERASERRSLPVPPS